MDPANESMSIWDPPIAICTPPAGIYHIFNLLQMLARDLAALNMIKHGYGTVTLSMPRAKGATDM